MVFNETLYNDLINSIQAQYKDTNIQAFLNGLTEIKKKYFFNAYKSLINDNLSITTAKGVGLDLWGVLLNFSRYIPTDTSTDKYKYFNFNNKRFYNLIFKDKNKPTYSALLDDTYRMLLVLIYQSMFIYPSIKGINDLLSEVLADFGKLRVGDTTDMSFMLIIFNQKIPNWLSYIAKTYDIIPRPAGVGVKLEEYYWKRFDFKTPNDEFNKQNIGNFFGKANFTTTPPQ